MKPSTTSILVRVTILLLVLPTALVEAAQSKPTELRAASYNHSTVMADTNNKKDRQGSISDETTLADWRWFQDYQKQRRTVLKEQFNGGISFDGPTDKFVYACPQLRQLKVGSEHIIKMCESRRMRQARQRERPQGDPTTYFHKQNPTSKCLIYSVSADHNSDFEQSLMEDFGNACEIHVFGSSGRSTHDSFAGTNNDERHPVVIHHDWNIVSAATSIDNQQQLLADNYMTFQETVTTLGHKGRILDILRVRCQACDWHSYNEWVSISKNNGLFVRQILVEAYEPFGPWTLPWYMYLMKSKKLTDRDYDDLLREQDFVLFHKERHSVSASQGNVTIQAGYLALHPDMFMTDEDGQRDTSLRQPMTARTA